MEKSLEQKEIVVEAICAEGCKFVNQLLLSESLQSRHKLFQALPAEHRQWVLTELHSIMNVYSDSGSCIV